MFDVPSLNLLEICKKKLLTQEDIVPLSTGSFSVFEVKHLEDSYVLKNYTDVKIISKSFRSLLSIFEKNVAGLTYRERFPDNEQKGKDILNLENAVLENWKKEHISAPKVVDTDYNSFLLLTKIDGKNYNSLLRDGLLKKNHVSALFDLVADIRKKAFISDNKFLLHNDMTLDNFLYETSGSAVAIDPGVLFKNDLSIEDLDAYFNLFFMYSVISEEFGFNTATKNDRLQILSAFNNSLDADTKDRMYSVNTPINPIEINLLRLTSTYGYNVEYKNFLETFNKDKYHQINSLLISE